MQSTDNMRVTYYFDSETLAHLAALRTGFSATTVTDAVRKALALCAALLPYADQGALPVSTDDGTKHILIP